MGDFTNKMGLATWDQPLDRYDYFQLSNNWQIVDFHDHSPGRGVQIPRGGIAPGAIGPTQLGADVQTQGTFATRPAAGVLGRRYYATDNNQWYVDNGTAWQTTHTTNGAVNIAGSESRTNTAYGTLTTPDQVTGIVLPANGLIEVYFAATWQESVAGAGNIAIFIGSNQLVVPSGSSATPQAQAAAVQSGAATATNRPVVSCPFGLVTPEYTTAYTGDVTTGQALALVPGASTNLYYSLGGTVMAATLSNAGGLGGPVLINNLPAGTYTISVQFKASSGSITASNRTLRVQALDFSG